MVKLVETFVEQVIEHSDYTELDKTYLVNRVLALVGEGCLDKTAKFDHVIFLKEALVDVAVENGRCGSLPEERDCLGAELMNFITPPPSVVNVRFWQTYQVDPKRAIADFYTLSQRNEYIKVDAIAQNVAFDVATDYGTLQITINLSKPEKDPKTIAAAKHLKKMSYPMDQLAMENEGYQGRLDHPARANHRIIRLSLGDEQWGFQYSPYAYFNEHCIFLNTEHVPMIINRQTFEQLLDIVTLFPDYFVGSNADLPIVGGSILTHNHYQGGRHTFPMEMAGLDSQFTFSGYEDIVAGIVNWPMSVIRLSGENKERLVELADKIRLCWSEYSDETVGILAKTGEVAHHTLTPIARKRDNRFELDLVLRDNQTSSEHPDGVYHPHRDVQHIKKENIGLIEVMGLAILPPRLKSELQEVEKYLLDQENHIAEYHKDWAERMKAEHGTLLADDVASTVQKAVGEVFVRVLEDAGVYKRDTLGQSAFQRFITAVGVEDEGGKVWPF